MPINYPAIRGLSPAEAGGFGGIDLAGSIRSGLENSNRIQEARFKPQQLLEELRAKRLANKINEAKAKFAEQQELANLQYTQAGTGNLGSQTSLNKTNIQRILQDIAQKKSQIQQDKSFQDLLSGNAQSVTNNESFIPSLSQKMKDGMINNTSEQVLTPGNPNLQHINNLYEQYPQYRKKLEAMGFKQTQNVKYDPKTGITSIVTKYPNGKVKVQTSNNLDSEHNPVTTATKTQAQKTITAITNAKPIIQKLIDDTKNGVVPGQWIGKYFQPDKQASYFSDVIQSSDTLAGALGFPGTNEGLHQAQQTVLRQPRESDSGYISRLQNLLKDIDKREETAQGNLNKGVPTHHKNKGRMKYNPSTGRLE